MSAWELVESSTAEKLAQKTSKTEEEDTVGECAERVEGLSTCTNLVPNLS